MAALNGHAAGLTYFAARCSSRLANTTRDTAVATEIVIEHLNTSKRIVSHSQVNLEIQRLTGGAISIHRSDGEVSPFYCKKHASTMSDFAPPKGNKNLRPIHSFHRRREKWKRRRVLFTPPLGIELISPKLHRKGCTCQNHASLITLRYVFSCSLSMALSAALIFVKLAKGPL